MIYIKDSPNLNKKEAEQTEKGDKLFETLKETSTTPETTETLKNELKALVKDKELKNYPWTAIDYLNSIYNNHIYNNNNIFSDEWSEKDRVKFLKKVIGWLKNPEDIEDVHFGDELVKGARREKEGVGYYNSDDYSKADLPDNEEVIKEMIKKITNDRTDGWGVNVPELAFLPLILNMSSGRFRSIGDFDNNKDFYLRVSKDSGIWINFNGGVLYAWNDDIYLHPARAVFQVS